jgi:hypothetical protein
LWGHIPQAPCQGASPPGPPIFPPPWALGSPAFWAPLVAGLLMWATRPLFWFCGGTPPTTPRQGAAPPGPPVLPTPVGFGFASVLGPTHGGVANAGYSPLLLVLWGHIPHTPCQGACAPWTPVFPPPWALGSPASWAPPVAGLLMWTTRPFFWFCGGTPPTTPRQGACAPSTPRFPTLVGFGFASVLGPTRGRVADVDNSPLLLVLWGHIPQTPCQGASPPGPPVCPPPWALGSPAFWAPLVARLLMRATRPSFGFVGGTPPQPPAMGAAPPGPPFAHPRWLRVCQRFAPSEAESPAKFSPFPRREGGQGVRSERHIFHSLRWGANWQGDQSGRWRITGVCVMLRQAKY